MSGRNQIRLVPRGTRESGREEEQGRGEEEQRREEEKRSREVKRGWREEEAGGKDTKRKERFRALVLPSYHGYHSLHCVPG